MNRLFLIVVLILISGITSCRNAALRISSETTMQRGLAAYETGDYKTALRLLEPLARQGDPTAQCKLGNMYWLGLGVPENNSRAAEWYQRAADNGDLDAMVALGTIYLSGAGVELDYKRAAELFRKPAELGVERAQFLLALLYLAGNGVPKDEVQAFVWLKLAEANGSKGARKALAELERKLTPEQLSKARQIARTKRPR